MSSLKDATDFSFLVGADDPPPAPAVDTGDNHAWRQFFPSDLPDDDSHETLQTLQFLDSPVPARPSFQAHASDYAEGVHSSWSALADEPSVSAAAPVHTTSSFPVGVPQFTDVEGSAGLADDLGPGGSRPRPGPLPNFAELVSGSAPFSPSLDQGLDPGSALSLSSPPPSGQNPHLSYHFPGSGLPSRTLDAGVVTAGTSRGFSSRTGLGGPPTSGTGPYPVRGDFSLPLHGLHRHAHVGVSHVLGRGRDLGGVSGGGAGSYGSGCTGASSAADASSDEFRDAPVLAPLPLPAHAPQPRALPGDPDDDVVFTDDPLPPATDPAGPRPRRGSERQPAAARPVSNARPHGSTFDASWGLPQPSAGGADVSTAPPAVYNSSSSLPPPATLPALRVPTPRGVSAGRAQSTPKKRTQSTSLAERDGDVPFFGWMSRGRVRQFKWAHDHALLSGDADVVATCRRSMRAEGAPVTPRAAEVAPVEEALFYRWVLLVRQRYIDFLVGCNLTQRENGAAGRELAIITTDAIAMLCNYAQPHSVALRRSIPCIPKTAAAMRAFESALRDAFRPHDPLVCDQEAERKPSISTLPPPAAVRTAVSDVGSPREAVHSPTSDSILESADTPTRGGGSATSSVGHAHASTTPQRACLRAALARAAATLPAPSARGPLQPAPAHLPHAARSCHPSSARPRIRLTRARTAGGTPTRGASHDPTELGPSLAWSLLHPAFDAAVYSVSTMADLRPEMRRRVCDEDVPARAATQEALAAASGSSTRGTGRTSKRRRPGVVRPYGGAREEPEPQSDEDDLPWVMQPLTGMKIARPHREVRIVLPTTLWKLCTYQDPKLKLTIGCFRNELALWKKLKPLKRTRKNDVQLILNALLVALHPDSEDYTTALETVLTKLVGRPARDPHIDDPFAGYREADPETRAAKARSLLRLLDSGIVRASAQALRLKIKLFRTALGGMPELIPHVTLADGVAPYFRVFDAPPQAAGPATTHAAPVGPAARRARSHPETEPEAHPVAASARSMVPPPPPPPEPAGADWARAARTWSSSSSAPASAAVTVTAAATAFASSSAFAAPMGGYPGTGFAMHGAPPMAFPFSLPFAGAGVPQGAPVSTGLGHPHFGLGLTWIPPTEPSLQDRTCPASMTEAGQDHR